MPVGPLGGLLGAPCGLLGASRGRGLEMPARVPRLGTRRLGGLLGRLGGLLGSPGALFGCSGALLEASWEPL
eukprot:8366678-Pyramimonas_sp.AAC.1